MTRDWVVRGVITIAVAAGFCWYCSYHCYCYIIVVVVVIVVIIVIIISISIAHE
jgi:hypothetical protein